MYSRLNRDIPKTMDEKKLNSVTYSSGYSILDEKKKKTFNRQLKQQFT